MFREWANQIDREGLGVRGEAALDLVEAGFSVLPCAPLVKARPLVGFSEPWQQAQLRDPNCLRKHWIEDPNRNLGLTLDGLLLVDQDDPEADVILDSFQWEWGLDAPWQLTPSGGKHHFFRLPDGVEFRNRGIKIADFKSGPTSFAMVAPSYVDAAQTTYEWGPGYSILEVAPPLLTEEMVESLRAAFGLDEKPSASTRVAKKKAEPLGQIPFKTRNTTLTSWAGRLDWHGIPAEIIELTLINVKDTYCEPGPTPSDAFTDAEVRKLVRSVTSMPNAPWYPTTSLPGFVAERCIDSSEVALMHVLIARCQPDGTNPHPPSVKGLSLDSKMEEKKVKRLLHALRDRGVIEFDVEHYGRKRDLTRLTFINIIQD